LVLLPADDAEGADAAEAGLVPPLGLAPVRLVVTTGADVAGAPPFNIVLTPARLLARLELLSA
jgi:hypothetical protein